VLKATRSTRWNTEERSGVIRTKNSELRLWRELGFCSEEKRERGECTVVEVGYPVFLQHRFTADDRGSGGRENQGLPAAQVNRAQTRPSAAADGGGRAVVHERKGRSRRRGSKETDAEGQKGWGLGNALDRVGRCGSSDHKIQRCVWSLSNVR